MTSYDPGLGQLAPFGFGLGTQDYQLYEGGTYVGPAVDDYLQVFYGAYTNQVGASGTWTRVGSSLFTTGNDIVDFNNLNSSQLAAVKNGADLYNALGGNDTVVLPAQTNSFQLPGTTVTWDPSQTFTVGALTDSSANTDTITGGSGNYNIAVVGSATVNITINGNGSSNITAGSGTNTISITGNGNNTITAGSSIDNVTIDGNGHSIITPGSGTLNATIAGGGTVELTGPTTPFSGSSITFAPAAINETLQIDGTTMPTAVIGGFSLTDAIDLRNVPFDPNGIATLFSTGGVNDLLEIDNTNGSTYDLTLSSPQLPIPKNQSFQLSSDGSGGTTIQLLSGLAAGFDAGNFPGRGTPVCVRGNRDPEGGRDEDHKGQYLGIPAFAATVVFGSSAWIKMRC